MGARKCQTHCVVRTEHEVCVQVCVEEPYGKGLQIARSIGLREGTICANIYGLGGRQGSGKRLTCLVGMEYTYGQVGKEWVRVESQGVEEPDVLAGNMSHSH